MNGTTVTVTPVNSQGQGFDAQTYNFAPDSVPPSAPGNLTLSQPSSSQNKLSWTAATDNIGVSAYDIYRNGTYLATVGPAVTSYTDSNVTAGASYTYLVAARDLAGNTTSTSVSTSGTSDTTPPTAPSDLTATATGYTTASLSWGASTDNVGVTGYTILRNGTAVATVAGHHDLVRGHRAHPGDHLHLSGHRIGCGGQRVAAQQHGLGHHRRRIPRRPHLPAT